MKMNPVVHFELPSIDQKRSVAFYTKAFGWDFNLLGDDMGNYAVAMTSESDKKGPLKPGRINGGIYTNTKEMGTMHPSVVIAVPDIKAHMKIVTDAGGKVIGEPMDIPGVGTFVSFTDTEGNKLSMLQPLEM
jgi:predicted enzyme related to lactoylglutathione lyase